MILATRSKYQLWSQNSVLTMGFLFRNRKRTKPDKAIYGIKNNRRDSFNQPENIALMPNPIRLAPINHRMEVCTKFIIQFLKLNPEINKLKLIFIRKNEI